VEAAQEIVKRAHAEAISNARRESRFMLEQVCAFSAPSFINPLYLLIPSHLVIRR
jgi:hypothetical protein